MAAHRSATDVKPAGNLFIAEPTPEQLQNFSLTGRDVPFTGTYVISNRRRFGPLRSEALPRLAFGWSPAAHTCSWESG